MTTTSNYVELMAPAGSYESLQAAIQAGCDSIYFGVEQLNMRSRSSINFTLDDLSDISSICRKARIKSYITLNTVMYDHDLSLVKRIVKSAKLNGISAIIASDHAVMSIARTEGMPVHISTQCNISNIETVAFYAAFADTMVLARELSLMQVAQITSEIKRRKITGPSGKPVEIEIFAHGALCMAISGKCYLSLHSHNASANRGACVQNCRRPYQVTDLEDNVELVVDNEYIMSAKDLCTIVFLDKVVDAGVKVLKIEGRGRSADYVYTTTSCYREALDSLADGSYTKEKIEGWKTRLAKVYNRGFWDGYYLGRKMGEWNDAYGSKATIKKVLLGQGVKYYGRNKVGVFEMETHTLKVGDSIIITGKKTGLIEATVEELRIDDMVVEEVKKGDLFSLPLSTTIRPADKLYKLIAAE